MYHCATLRVMSFPTSTKTRVALAVAGVAVVAALTAGIVLAFTGGDESPAGTPQATPVANGINRPDPSCVTTTGTDHNDMWDANGWWAGRIDGTAKEMPALSVLSLKLKGHQISNAWICAPRA